MKLEFNKDALGVVGDYKTVPMGFETFQNASKTSHSQHYKTVPMGFETDIMTMNENNDRLL